MKNMKKRGTLALLFLIVGTGVARMKGKDSACGIENVDCTASESGSAYTGTISKTKTGMECQAWNDQSPHQHSVGTEMEHNHCRNPDGKPGIWCYTKDSNTTWDFCEVRKCRDCKRDLDFEDDENEKGIVKLEGRCTVKKTAKTVLTGIKTKAECLTACLANGNATGCQYRKVKKRCKVVTGSFEKASNQSGVTCWRFDDVSNHAMDAAVFSNMTETRGYGDVSCGDGTQCPWYGPWCCIYQGKHPGKCCWLNVPQCHKDGTCTIPNAYHPSLKRKHILEGDGHSKKEVEEKCMPRLHEKIPANDVITGTLVSTVDAEGTEGKEVIHTIYGIHHKCRKKCIKVLWYLYCYGFDCNPLKEEKSYVKIRVRSSNGHLF